MHVTNRTVDRVEICSCYILVIEYYKKIVKIYIYSLMCLIKVHHLRDIEGEEKTIYWKKLSKEGEI